MSLFYRFLTSKKGERKSQFKFDNLKIKQVFAGVRKHSNSA